MIEKKEYIRRYWFGINDKDDVADTVLLMERDRLEQYKAALDFTLCHFHGVFNGLTGLLNGKKITVIHSIGPAHIADCVSFLANGFDVKQFIATGSIGGLATSMGDIVVSNECASQDGFSYTVFHDDIQIEKDLGSIVKIKMPETLTVTEGIKSKIKNSFHCDIKFGSIFTIPAVSLEGQNYLTDIKDKGYIALDLETGPFLAACKLNKVQGFCIHWVTDLPLERNFYYQFDGDPEIITYDKELKHNQWLNMPRLILPILSDLIS